MALRPSAHENYWESFLKHSFAHVSLPDQKNQNFGRWGRFTNSPGDSNAQQGQQLPDLEPWFWIKETGFKSYFSNTLGILSWPSHVTLSLSFLIYEMGLIIPARWGFGMDTVCEGIN